MNMYDDPAKFNLEIVGELDEYLSYAFNLLVVWRNIRTGQLYYAHDSGCSCPIPFEYYNMANLPWLGKDNFSTFEKEVMDFPDDLQSRIDLVDKVRKLLK